jgi:hypothetical protein
MSRLVLLLALLLPAGAMAHDGYTGLMSPTGVSCCSDRDCQPVRACMAAGDKEGLVLDGACVELPENKVIEAPHLAGYHACWMPGTPRGSFA